jgi:hypothetical protein
MSESSSYAGVSLDQDMMLGVQIFLGVAGAWAMFLCAMLIRAVVVGDRRYREDAEHRLRTRRPARPFSRT